MCLFLSGEKNMLKNYLTVALFSMCIGAYTMPIMATETTGVSIWMPCWGMKNKVYIANYLSISTVGMHRSEIEERYCVPRAQCVAMGYCTTTDPAELEEAKKYKAKSEQQKREAARLKVERERKARLEKLKAEEAERKRIIAENEEQIRVNREANELQKKLNISQKQAQELSSAKSKANQSRPPQKKICTTHINASESVIQYSGSTPVDYIKENHARTESSSLCNGYGGTLGSLQCNNQVGFFGVTFAKCSAKVTCPARKIDQPCSTATKN